MSRPHLTAWLLGALASCGPAPAQTPDAADLLDAAVADAPDAFRPGFDGGPDFVPESRRCDGQRLEGLYEGEWLDLGACAYAGPNQCRSGARIYHWDEGPGPSTACLPDVIPWDLVATSEDDAWIGGSQGVWRWDGRYWTEVTPAGEGPLGAARLAVADVGRAWLFLPLSSDSYQLLHHDGSEWQSAEPSGVGPVAWSDGVLSGGAPVLLAAQPGGHVWLGDPFGDLRLLHFDGVRWAWEDLAGPGRPLALATHGSDLWVARAAPEGLVIDRWAGGRFESVTGGAALDVTAVSQFMPIAGDDSWIAEPSGSHHWNGASWITRALPEGLSVSSLVAPGDEVLALSFSGGLGGPGLTHVFRWDGADWLEAHDGVAGVIATFPGVQARSLGSDVWIFPEVHAR